MAKKKNDKRPIRDDDDKPDAMRHPGPGNDLVIPGCIGDAVAFVSNGQEIRIRISAVPFQFEKLLKGLITECAARKGKYHKYAALLKDLDQLLLSAKFRVRADVWLGMRDLLVNLPAQSGEIVPTGWADPRPKAGEDSEEDA